MFFNLYFLGCGHHLRFLFGQRLQEEKGLSLSKPTSVWRRKDVKKYVKKMFFSQNISSSA